MALVSSERPVNRESTSEVQDTNSRGAVRESSTQGGGEDLDSIKHQLLDRDREKASLQSTIEGLNVELANLQERLATFEVERAQLRGQIASLDEKNLRVTSALDAANLRLATLDAANLRLATAEMELNSLRKQTSKKQILNERQDAEEEMTEAGDKYVFEPRVEQARKSNKMKFAVHPENDEAEQIQAGESQHNQSRAEDECIRNVDYIQKIIESLNLDLMKRQGSDTEFQRAVSLQVASLEQLKKVVAARLDKECNSPGAGELIFDENLDDDEVLLRFFRELDIDGGGTIGKSELFHSEQLQKSDNLEMAKALKRAYVCNLDDFDEALVNLNESDFGAYARYKQNESDELVFGEGGAQTTFDRRDSVKAVFDEVNSKNPLFSKEESSNEKTNSGFQGGIKRGQIECLIQELRYVKCGEQTDNSRLSDALGTLVASLLPSDSIVNFLSLKAAARKVPRVSGQRMEWIRALKLEAALARHLPPGTLDDALEGVRKLSQEKDSVNQLLEAFFDDVRRRFQTALEHIFVVGGSKSAVEANSKFEGFPGSFATLKEFDAGAEVTLQLGYPNPDVGKGIRLEHTEHPSVTRVFVTPNYRIATCLLVEYWWAIFEECPEDPVVRRVRDRALMCLDKLGRQREITADGPLLFPGEVGDSFTESLVVVQVQLGSVDKVAETKCAEAAKSAANEILETEEERARGFTLLDHQSCIQWMTQCSAILREQRATMVGATEHGWSIGVFLPMSKVRADKACDAFRKKIAGAVGISNESVNVFVHNSRTWLYCEHCDIEEFRREIKALSMAELKSLISGPNLAKVETYDAVCSEAIKWFVREHLAHDFRAALGDSDDSVIQTLLISLGVTTENLMSLSRLQKIDLAVLRLDSEQRWLEVEEWVRHYRGRLKGRVRLGLRKLMQRERSKIEKLDLVAEEVLGLYLYTGPEYLLMNATCRSFPKSILDLLLGDGSTNRNTLCTTLFCISSGLKKLSRHTELPESRMVYRGLGKMLLPQEFWVLHGTPAWRGGVERAFLSTTADKNVALFYANGRGTVVEISVGRIQIGGDVSFLSMYPGEKEITFPPFTCLEANGNPRVERTQAGEVVVFPLQASVNPKAETVEELQGRRKRLHLGMCKLLREDLSLLAEQRLAENLAASVDFRPRLRACVQAQPEAVRAKIKRRVREEFDALVVAHEAVEQAVFNTDDVEYKRLMAEAVDGKAHALAKMGIYLEALASGLDAQAVARIYRAPILSLASPAMVLELRTGLTEFPWAAVVEERSATVNLGHWNGAGVASWALDMVAAALRDNTNLRSLIVKDAKLDLPDGWNSTALQWGGVEAVKAVPVTVALVLRNCGNVTALDLSSDRMGPEGIAALCPTLRTLTALQSLDLSGNDLGPAGVQTLSPALAGLLALEELNLGCRPDPFKAF